jgi:hypothetical protein
LDSHRDCPAETTPTDLESQSRDRQAVRDAGGGAEDGAVRGDFLPSAGRVVGGCGGDGRGMAGCRSASAVPLPVVRAAGASGVVVAPEVAAVIVVGWAGGAGLSELTRRWRMTPGELRAVLRGVRVAPVVAEPVVACGPVGGMLVRAVRAAQGSRDGVVVGAGRLAGPASLLLRAGAGPAVHAPPGPRLGEGEARAGSGRRGAAVGLPAGAGPRTAGGCVMGVERPRGVGGGAGLERAPKPPDLWDVMRARVDRVFAGFLGGEDPLVWRGGAGPRDAA